MLGVEVRSTTSKKSTLPTILLLFPLKTFSLASALGGTRAFFFDFGVIFVKRLLPDSKFRGNSWSHLGELYVLLRKSLVWLCARQAPDHFLHLPGHMGFSLALTAVLVAELFGTAVFMHVLLSSHFLSMVSSHFL